VLDIGYILQWGKPKDDKHFSFWAAPASWFSGKSVSWKYTLSQSLTGACPLNRVTQGRIGRSHERQDIFRANMTLRDLHGHGDKLDIMRHFSEACRADLKR
jgi:hypothetical protein